MVRFGTGRGPTGTFGTGQETLSKVRNGLGDYR